MVEHDILMTHLYLNNILFSLILNETIIWVILSKQLKRSKTNFFVGVWRTPSGDIDRPGNFSRHIAKCVKLSLDLAVLIGKLCHHFTTVTISSPSSFFIGNASSFFLMWVAPNRGIFSILRRVYIVWIIVVKSVSRWLWVILIRGTFPWRTFHI